MNDQVEQTEGEENERDFEGEAREMGWVPKGEFHEEPEKWIDAEEFVKRGENILPILRSNNRKLKQELLTKDAAIANLQQSVASQGKALKALQKGYSEATKREVETAKQELREQLKVARAEGDIDTEVSLQEKLGDLREAEREAKDKEKEVETPEGNEKEFKPDPIFVKWNKENPWFGDDSNFDNRRRSKQLLDIGNELRKEGDTSSGLAYLDKCMEILLDRESKALSQRGTSKVEGSGGGRTSARSGRAFDKLPKEAKEVCHTDNEKFVGAGKMFKTVAEWENHYADLYGED